MHQFVNHMLRAIPWSWRSSIKRIPGAAPLQRFLVSRALDDLISQHFEGGEVDYISIDTEGSELKILDGFSFAGNPTVLTIEHNFTDNRDAIRRIMSRNGYVNIMPTITCFDDWFVREDIFAAINSRSDRAI